MPLPPASGLPIDAAIDDLTATLARHPIVVLQAPPGAGKTTIVPLALIDRDWLGGQRLVMLEPRRIAARAAAHRMAALRHEAVGATVGYRTRLDTRVGAATRIEVVTEGVLTRMLQHDPTLEGYGLVLFDEFHERSLHADTGLALTLYTQAVVRPELRVLVMSATLDGPALARRLGDAPLVICEGRQFPVETRYAPHPRELGIETAVAAAARKALRDHPDGDVLVFLPGAREIHRVAALLDAQSHALPDRVDVRLLHGLLDAE
ncbi:MAG TPA: DEAD/DEAH box helicase, partial [Vicinamibacterales bacterium]|nr:DEAD/DEAH box helicase [Vicinamibacterales bacterium]